MYALCNYRLKFYLPPSTSKKVVCNSWWFNQDITPDDTVLNSASNMNCLIPYNSVSTLSLLPDISLPHSNNEWLLIRRKNKNYGLSEGHELNFDVYNSLVSLPIIYMSRDQLQVNQSVSNIHLCKPKETSLLSLHQLLASVPNSASEKVIGEKLVKKLKLAKKNFVDKLDHSLSKAKLNTLGKPGPEKKMKQVSIKVINIRKASSAHGDNEECNMPPNKASCDERNRQSCRTSWPGASGSADTESGSCAAPKIDTPKTDTPKTGAPAIGTPKTAAAKTAVAKAGDGAGVKSDGGSSGSGGGLSSWAAIEKKLPGWQNFIADILQKLQDIVFKKPK